ncbi:MAG: phosphatidylinositol-specific phospholipase C/glycerophosphodiester phosphodiesterase family protein [Anaerostipes sp.]|nr:phosphatidylinositol-specific phospholipase C/glycerophosphodiester phosphodiesterase family protein [Anaerostipes sp.]
MTKKNKFKSKQFKRLKKRQRQRHIAMAIIVSFFLLILLGIYIIIFPIIRNFQKKETATTAKKVTTVTKKVTTTEKNWYDYNAIAHALGGIDGHDYTNSKEAFEASIKNGFHIFEVDLLQTTDNVLVGRHTWGEDLSDPLSKGDDNRVSYDTFKNTKLYGKYTPLSLEDIFNIMDKHPDIYVMTDTKDGGYAASASDAKIIVQTAKKMGKEKLLDRLIIQIYNENMVRAVRSQYDFKHILYTTYKQSDLAFSQMINFCKNNQIEAVTVPQKSVNDYRMKLLEDANLKSFTHTINNTYLVEQYMQLGVYGIYTDFVSSSDIRETYLNLQSDKLIKTYSDALTK